MSYDARLRMAGARAAIPARALAALAAAAIASSSVAPAAGGQARARRLFAGVSGGVSVYDARDVDRGIGVQARLLSEYRPAGAAFALRAELGHHRFTAMTRSCPASVPGGCSPEPPDRMWSASVHAMYPAHAGAVRLFASGGAGAYWRRTQASSGTAATVTTTAGVEAGAGVAMRSTDATMLVELRYVSVGGGRHRAGIWPVTIGLLF